MTSSQIFVGIGLIVGLALGCQVVATKLRLPSILLLLPVGFAAGALTTVVRPDTLLGPAFPPLVSLAVALVLFDGGLDLKVGELEGHERAVVRRLVFLGVPLTWAGGTLVAWGIFGISGKGALMLGAVLIVSGPTVVAPLLEVARPRRRLRSVLSWESTLVDPIGAIIAVLVFEVLVNGASFRGPFVLHFGADIGLGLLGAAVGTAALWFLLAKVKLSGVLATEATIGVVIVVSAVCDAIQDDTGLVAAIVMGVALANLRGVPSPEDRPFFQTIVQLVIGILFISISATVTPASLHGVILPTLVLVAALVFLVRPLVAASATARTSLTRNERVYVGLIDPRGIVAASTAATFAAPLAAAKVGGAGKLLPVTFLVIVGTVVWSGVAALTTTRRLRLEA